MFADHRKKLLAEISAPVIVTAYTKMQLSADGAAPFQQEANFFWLTGITEPDWRLIATPEKSYLVAPRQDETHALFDGSLAPEEAQAMSQVDEVVDFETGRLIVRRLAEKYATGYTLGDDPHAQHYDFTLNPAQRDLKTQLQKQFSEICDVRPVLEKLRAIKSPQEIQRIQTAIEQTIEGFRLVRQRLHQAEFQHEYEIEVAYTYQFRATGGEGHAYQPIVAGGSHACTLHYVKNNDTLPADGLVLLDVGARSDGYAADITRTYAVGTPTERQRAVHAAVEVAHHDIINLIKPGLTLKEYSHQVDEIMKGALRSLELLKTDDDYRKYFPHAISHSLGIDVHDTLGGYKEFKPGMVLTVEPGIYIPEEGIGVRIEDDILVTNDGHENLSAALPTAL